MAQGINRALIVNKSFNQHYTTASLRKPCIFLSHRSLDKDMVREIGKYITKAGIDIYLDENDQELQNADAEGNDRKVTQCIQKGIEESTHVLCLLSPSTISAESWWVPYEIGFGERGKKDICSLKLKPLNENLIPSYLKIRRWLKGIHDLNAYLQEINNKNNYVIKSFSKYNDSQYKLYNDSAILEESVSFHPLKDYLDQ